MCASRSAGRAKKENQKRVSLTFADVETKRSIMADPTHALPVLTCDGDAVPLEEARTLSRKHECLFFVFGGERKVTKQRPTS